MLNMDGGEPAVGTLLNDEADRPQVKISNRLNFYWLRNIALDLLSELAQHL